MWDEEQKGKVGGKVIPEASGEGEGQRGRERDGGEEEGGTEGTERGVGERE